MGSTDLSLARMRAAQDALRAALQAQSDTTAVTALALSATVEVLAVITERVIPAETTPEPETVPDPEVDESAGE